MEKFEQTATPPPRLTQDAGLRPQCLGFKEVLGSSLGSMGLTGTVIIGVPIVFARGGAFTPLIFLAAMCAFLVVAAQINVFARKIATHGSLYDYVDWVFGAKVGAVAGWAIMIAYVASVPAYLATGPYALIHMVQTGLGANPGHHEFVIIAFAVMLLASWFSIRNVTISTRAALAIDFISLGILALVALEYWPGLDVFSSGITMHPDIAPQFLAGLPLAMTCFTGFETACVFGVEAKHPLTDIPRTNWLTVLVTGGVTFAASGSLIGIYHTLPPDYEAAPLSVLVDAGGAQWGLSILLVAAALSWFGCLLGCLNTGGRLLYSLALQGQLWKAVGYIHPRFETPIIAITMIAATGIAATTSLILADVAIMDILIGTATVAAPCILLAYAMVSAAAVVERWRNAEKHQRWIYAVAGALAIVSMLFPMLGLMTSLE